MIEEYAEEEKIAEGITSGGEEKEGGIKYTLSVKSTLFWDFSMHAVLPEMYVVFSRVAAAEIDGR